MVRLGGSQSNIFRNTVRTVRVWKGDGTARARRPGNRNGSISERGKAFEREWMGHLAAFGRVRINLFGPSDLKWNSAAGAVESDRKYPLPPAMRDKNKTGPVEVKSYPLPPPVHASGYPPPPVVLAGGQAAAWAGQQAGAAQAASQAQAQQQAAAAQAASQAQAQQQAAFQFMQAAQMAPRFIPPPPPVSRPPMPLPPSPSPVFVPPAPVFQAPPPVNPYFPPLPPVIVIPQPNNSANSFSILQSNLHIQSDGLYKQWGSTCRYVARERSKCLSLRAAKTVRFGKAGRKSRTKFRCQARRKRPDVHPCSLATLARRQQFLSGAFSQFLTASCHRVLSPPLGRGRIFSSVYSQSGVKPLDSEQITCSPLWEWQALSALPARRAASVEPLTALRMGIAVPAFDWNSRAKTH